MTDSGRSPTQPAADKDLRGDNFDDAETARAIAYRDHIQQMALVGMAHLDKLKGDRQAYRDLQHKTLPLTNAAPPYIEGP